MRGLLRAFLAAGSRIWNLKVAVLLINLILGINCNPIPCDQECFLAYSIGRISIKRLKIMLDLILMALYRKKCRKILGFLWSIILRDE